MLQTYYRLTKPGIIYGNALNVAAGYFLAAGVLRHFIFGRLLAVLAGSALVVASGCVCNNYIDRGIDHRMARTKKRALVSGAVSGRAALTYGAILGVAGFAVLAAWTNWLTVAVGAVGMLFYVVLYSIGKRASVHGTLIGSVSGAVPPVAGYTALTGHLDAGAWILFAILVAWQMPHFYAIAIYRFNDYKNAGLPVLPVVKGLRHTKIQIAAYIAAFVVATSLLTVYGYTGVIYLVVTAALGIMWFIKALQGFRRGIDDAKWARKLFFFSLVITLALDIMLSVGALLP
ncbi:MAG TPA: heme o synthase [Candidatus Saccharimonadales bacterium]|nr:heme o synthase [Candidatus Saccharimonadales bacterium]